MDAKARQGVQAYVTAAGGQQLGEVVGAIASACNEIARKIRLAGLDGIYGAAGAVNVQGEQQQKLDVFANDTLIARLRAVPSVAGIVSEEDDAAVVFEGNDKGEFVAIFDPLDGSSNIDVNVNVGTILGIQRVQGGDVSAAAMQPGSAQVAALYVVYGPSVVLVLALAGVEGVAAFTLDEEGRFVLIEEALQMPEQGPYYSANEANEAEWPAGYATFVERVRRGDLGGATVKPYGARYIGSLVADFHRTLLKGGVFFYPPTEKAPGGKLRLLYEANPLAMIAEAAGGQATNGMDRILSIEPGALHQRTALVIGGRREVEALTEMVTGAAIL